MEDYEEMYKKIFVAVTQAIEILQKAQMEAEELYIEGSADISPLLKFPFGNDGKAGSPMS